MMKIYLPLVKRKRDCFFLQGLFSHIESLSMYWSIENCRTHGFIFMENRNKKFQCLRTPGTIQLAFTEQLIPCHVHQRAKLAVFGWTEKIGSKFNYKKRNDCGIKLAIFIYQLLMWWNELSWNSMSINTLIYL